MLLLLEEEKALRWIPRTTHRPASANSARWQLLGGGEGSTKSCRDSPTVPTATTMPCRHNQQQLLGLWTRSAHPAQFWGCSLCKSRGAATPQTNCGQQRDSRGKSRPGR